jgi:hypothetical protein
LAQKPDRLRVISNWQPVRVALQLTETRGASLSVYERRVQGHADGLVLLICRQYHRGRQAG